MVRCPICNGAIVIEHRLKTIEPGSDIRIRDEFAPGAEYTLVLEVRTDDFDPASGDPSLMAG